MLVLGKDVLVTFMHNYINLFGCSLGLTLPLNVSLKLFVCFKLIVTHKACKRSLLMYLSSVQFQLVLEQEFLLTFCAFKLILVIIFHVKSQYLHIRCCELALFYTF